MTFIFKQAVRQNVSLLIGLAGPSGSGKTYSALALATGLAGPGGKIAGIDTEAGRMLHYADQFKFDHGDLAPPFGPDRYIEAIEAADSAGYSVIVIDSMSHEWEGEGGLHDMQEELLEAQVEKARSSHSGNWQFDEDKTRERLSVGAWKKPKMLHKRFVSRLLQCRAHLVMCLRADEKMRIEKVKDDRGREKTVIIQAKDLPPAERWSPICERRFPYELGLSFVLTPQNPGLPVPLKLQEQHRHIFKDGQLIGKAAGEALAKWAHGDVAVPISAPVLASANAEIIADGDHQSAKGTAAFRAWWQNVLTKPQRQTLAARLDGWKAAATLADEPDVGFDEPAPQEAHESHVGASPVAGGEIPAGAMIAPQPKGGGVDPSAPPSGQDDDDTPGFDALFTKARVKADGGTGVFNRWHSALSDHDKAQLDRVKLGLLAAAAMATKAADRGAA